MNFTGVSLLYGYNLRVRNKNRLLKAIDQVCIKIGILGSIDPPLSKYAICSRLLQISQDIKSELTRLIDLALHLKFKEDSEACQKLNVLDALCDSLVETYMDVCSESAAMLRASGELGNVKPNDECLNDVGENTCEICFIGDKKYTCNECLGLVCSGCFKRLDCCPFCRSSF